MDSNIPFPGNIKVILFKTDVNSASRKLDYIKYSNESQ